MTSLATSLKSSSRRQAGGANGVVTVDMLLPQLNIIPMKKRQ